MRQVSRPPKASSLKMPSWHIHRFEGISSTQDVALEHAAAGAPEGTVIVAKVQTSGRGRSGNIWQSLDGNLFCSVILRPLIERTQTGQYSFLSAIALNRTLSEILNESHAIQNKWPNDVLVDGKKIAGILLEAVDGALIIGVGVNIVVAPDDRTSLAAMGADLETYATVLATLLANLDEVLQEFDKEGFAALREEWLDNAINLHKPIKVRLPHEVLEGVFDGLEADGALRLRLANDDIKVIHSGEVFFG